MMDLSTFERLVANSEYEDWTFISCGGGSGASFLESITTWTNGSGELSGIDVESHYQVMSFKGDLLIAAAHGMQHVEDFREDWVATAFPHRGASSGFVDFFYARNLVFRDIYVSVDGGRCLLPLPKQTFDDNGNVTSLTVTEQRARFFSVLNGSGGAGDVYSYLRRAGIEVVEGGWMSASESY